MDYAKCEQEVKLSTFSMLNWLLTSRTLHNGVKMQSSLLIDTTTPAFRSIQLERYYIFHNSSIG